MHDSASNFFFNHAYFLALILWIGGLLGAGSIYLRKKHGTTFHWRAYAIVLVLVVIGELGADLAEEKIRGDSAASSQALIDLIGDELEQGGHAQITQNTASNDPTYLRLIEVQLRILRRSSMVGDVYTLRPGADGVVVILVDSETFNDGGGKFRGGRGPRTAIGKTYTPPNGGFARALAGEVNFDREAQRNEWGTWMTGWAPLRRPDQSVEGVLAVDFAADGLVGAGRKARLLSTMIAAGFISLFVTGAVLLSVLRVGVSESRRAEVTAKESETRIALIIDTALDAVVTMDQAGMITAWNRQAEVIFGWTAMEAIGVELANLIVPPRYRDAHRRGFQRFLDTGQNRVFGRRLELVALRRDGSEFPVELAINSVFAGGRQYFSSFLRDISGRKNAEEELHALTAGLAQAQRIGGIGSWEVNLATDGFQCSDVALEIFGYKRGDLELTVAAFKAAVHPDDRARHSKAFAQAIALGAGYNIDLRILVAEGSIRHVQQRGEVINDATGRAVRVLGTILNMTERVQAESAARRSQKQFENLFESAATALLVSDGEGRIVLVNKEAEDILNRKREDLRTLSLDAVMQASGFFQEGSALPMRPIEGDVSRAIFLRGKRADGREFAGELVARSFEMESGLGTVVQINDRTASEISRRVQLRAQRMESIGTLSGGVAHDLNNALAPITMGLELLRVRYPAEHSIITTMEKCSQRAAGMVRQLLTFARGSEGERRQLNPRFLLDELVSIAHHTFPKNITIVTDFELGLAEVLGDGTQLHQVLLNLCINARDAMPHGGTLTLSARNTELAESIGGAAAGPKAGRYVEWLVTDSGTGMSPEVLERIFDPFFTTKDPDKGTGLGLSTVLGIIRSHEGAIQVDSVMGKGSTFKVFLPFAVVEEELSAVTVATAGLARGRGETVLVVDDELTVREITRVVLTELNYRVILAVDGTDALMKLVDNPSEISVVITDLQMPHMDGRVLIEALRRMSPDARIILASGTVGALDDASFRALGVHAILRKPFSRADLVAALAAALSKNPVSSQAT